jgi:predicted enzyme related to lactoylglutathione lyase
MKAHFTHVNLVAKNWRLLADFYIKVFGCTETGAQRDLKDEWVDQLTGLSQAHIQGVHLKLPGYQEDGPTLEIFHYNRSISDNAKEINAQGFGHIAFAVEDVHQHAKLLVAHGGSLLGSVVKAAISGAGQIEVVYARDPEGNLIELQNWTL